MSRHIVIEGNLTRDPNGGYGKDTGKAYTHLDVAVTDRTKNEQGEWVDGPATYYRVTAFGKTAENALNSLAKGNTIVATGQLTVRTYTRTDGTPAPPTKSSPTTSEQPSPTPPSRSTRRPPRPAERA